MQLGLWDLHASHDHIDSSQIPSTHILIHGDMSTAFLFLILSYNVLDKYTVNKNTPTYFAHSPFKLCENIWQPEKKFLQRKKQASHSRKWKIGGKFYVFLELQAMVSCYLPLHSKAPKIKAIFDVIFQQSLLDLCTLHTKDNWFS